MGDRRPAHPAPCRVQRRGPDGRPQAPCPAGRCTAPLSASSRQRFQGRGPAAPARRRRPAATPCHLRRASVVSTSEAGTDDARELPRPARPPSLNAGTTAGQRAFAARCLPDGLGGLNSPRQDDVKSCLNPSRGANRRAEGLPIRKKRIVLTACFNTCGFSPAGSGH